MIFVHFQGKPFSIKVIQVYATTTNAKEAEVKYFYDNLQGLLEQHQKKSTKNKYSTSYYNLEVHIN